MILGSSLAEKRPLERVRSASRERDRSLEQLLASFDAGADFARLIRLTFRCFGV